MSAQPLVELRAVEQEIADKELALQQLRRRKTDLSRQVTLLTVFGWVVLREFSGKSGTIEPASCEAVSRPAALGHWGISYRITANGHLTINKCYYASDSATYRLRDGECFRISQGSVVGYFRDFDRAEQFLRASLKDTPLNDPDDDDDETLQQKTLKWSAVGVWVRTKPEEISMEEDREASRW